MKRLIIIVMLTATGTVSFAQETAYISRDKTTALVFNTAVKVIGQVPADFNVLQRENNLITLKATRFSFVPAHFDVQEISTSRIYHIPVEYSYGRAGRRIEIGQKIPMVVKAIPRSEYNYKAVTDKLAAGKRKNVVNHEQSGGVKAWINKLSLAGAQVFFRLDIRNNSNLPYEVDFIRFYIRDLKTVARMATHEQEIIPTYTSLDKGTIIVKHQEIIRAFGFRRFSLSEDQALNVELYERNGNRHLYLHIKKKDLDNLEIINPAQQQPVTIAAQLVNPLFNF